MNGTGSCSERQGLCSPQQRARPVNILGSLGPQVLLKVLDSATVTGKETQLACREAGQAVFHFTKTGSRMDLAARPRSANSW